MNTFGQAFNQADEKTKTLIESTVVFDCVKSQLDSMDKSALRSIASNVTHLFLNLKDEATVINLMSSLGIADAQSKLSSIKVCVSSNTPTKEDFSAIENEEEGVEDIAHEINQLENIVNPVRTMANDMETAREGQTYASSQDSLLQKQTPTDPDQARWQQTN